MCPIGQMPIVRVKQKDSSGLIPHALEARHTWWTGDFAKSSKTKRQSIDFEDCALIIEGKPYSNRDDVELHLLLKICHI